MNARLFAVSAVLVIATFALLAGVIALFGPVPGMAFYIGLVLMTSVVRALEPRDAWLAVVFSTLAATLGAWAGPHLPWLAVAIVAVCLGQSYFTIRSARAVAVLPAITAYHALMSPPGHVWQIALATFIGAALLVGVARVVKLKASSTPTTPRVAYVHAGVLAVGSILLLLVGMHEGFARVVFGMEGGLPRAWWALLCFSLVLVPGLKGWKHALTYVGAAAVGVFLAGLVGAVDWVPLTLVVLLALATCTVAFTLAGRFGASVAALTPTVILLGGVTTQEAQADLATQRGGLAATAVVLALVIAAIAGFVESRYRKAHPIDPWS